MEEQIHPENSGQIQEIRNDKGQYIKGVSGNPSGKPLGAKNRFSPVMKIQEIWEENPEEFDDFINKYLRDPRNRQHIVEMMDGKPKGLGTVIPTQNNIYVGSPEQDALILEQEIRDINEELSKGKLKISDGIIVKNNL